MIQARAIFAKRRRDIIAFVVFAVLAVAEFAFCPLTPFVGRVVVAAA